MSQNWNIPILLTDNAGAAITTAVSDAFASLRTLFSGNSAPLSTAAHMLWFQPSTGLLWKRNAGDSDWIDVLVEAHKCEFGALSATSTRRVIASKRGFQVVRVALLSDTPSVSSSGNEWQFSLTNATTAVQLFSGTVGTFTALGGVGGGAEIVANTAYLLTPNQNTTLAVNDVLTFTCTKLGTATTLADLSVIVEGRPAL